MAKMHHLIDEVNTEVGWHGTIERYSDNEYIIDDIFVYPQVVTGTNIDPDQKAYEEWLDAFDDETFNTLHFHGHSHVNMGVFSSGTDDGFQKRIIEQLRGDQFYLFFIMNKKGERFIRLYDNRYGLMYETSDCDVEILQTDEEADWLKEAKKKIVERTYVVPHSVSSYYERMYNWGKQQSHTPKQQKTQSLPAKTGHQHYDDIPCYQCQDMDCMNCPEYWGGMG